MSSKKNPPAMASFRQAYEVLQGHAEALRAQTEPNIDDLLDIVNESVQAYKLCKQRIDAVEQALQQALDDSAIAELATSPNARPGAGAQTGQQDRGGVGAANAEVEVDSDTDSDSDTDADDIPF